MTAGRSDRGPVRFRRRGRHTAPTPVEKVAQQAGKAAPAVAIAGALVAAPQASHALAGHAAPAAMTAQGHVTTTASTASAATTGAGTVARATLDSADSVATRTVTVASATPARHAARAQSTTYRVQPGDTLSRLASRFFHNGDWQYLYHENAKTISDPNLIYTGQSLVIPASAPAHYTLAGYVPRHAKPAAAPAVHTAAPAVHTVSASSDGDNDASGQGAASGTGGTSGSTAHATAAVVQAAPAPASQAVQQAPQGQYSCSGLEQLWEQAGGSPGAAFMAAEIAMAESSGNPNAISPTDDYGLWQINASNGALATLNPLANAKSAIVLSGNGTNWGPWTTYRTGAYYGRC